MHVRILFLKVLILAIVFLSRAHAGTDYTITIDNQSPTDKKITTISSQAWIPLDLQANTVKAGEKQEMHTTADYGWLGDLLFNSNFYIQFSISDASDSNKNSSTFYLIYMIHIGEFRSHTWLVNETKNEVLQFDTNEGLNILITPGNEYFMTDNAAFSKLSDTTIASIMDDNGRAKSGGDGYQNRDQKIIFYNDQDANLQLLHISSVCPLNPNLQNALSPCITPHQSDIIELEFIPGDDLILSYDTNVLSTLVCATVLARFPTLKELHHLFTGEYLWNDFVFVNEPLYFYYPDLLIFTFKNVKTGKTCDITASNYVKYEDNPAVQQNFFLANPFVLAYAKFEGTSLSNTGFMYLYKGKDLPVPDMKSLSNLQVNLAISKCGLANLSLTITNQTSFSFSQFKIGSDEKKKFINTTDYFNATYSLSSYDSFSLESTENELPSRFNFSFYDSTNQLITIEFSTTESIHSCKILDPGSRYGCQITPTTQGDILTIISSINSTVPV